MSKNQYRKKFHLTTFLQINSLFPFTVFVKFSQSLIEKFLSGGKIGELERDRRAFDCKKIFSDVCKSVLTRRALSNGEVDVDINNNELGTLQPFFIAHALNFFITMKMR